MQVPVQVVSLLETSVALVAEGPLELVFLKDPVQVFILKRPAVLAFLDGPFDFVVNL